MGSCTVCLFVTGFLHLTQWPLVPAMWLHMTKHPPFHDQVIVQHLLCPINLVQPSVWVAACVPFLGYRNYAIRCKGSVSSTDWLVSLGFPPSEGVVGSHSRSAWFSEHSLCCLPSPPSAFTFSPQPHQLAPAVFGNRPPYWAEIVAHCSFDLHVLVMDEVEHSLTHLLTTCAPSFEKGLFVKWLVCYMWLSWSHTHL